MSERFACSASSLESASEASSDALSRELAEQANRSDILAGLAIGDQPDEVADILFDLARRETRNTSERFARVLVTGLRPKLKLNKTPRRRADFRVLRSPDVPSVLLELGYMSNRDDEKLLLSEKWQEKAAAAVARAVEAFVAAPAKKP